MAAWSCQNDPRERKEKQNLTTSPSKSRRNNIHLWQQADGLIVRQPSGLHHAAQNTQKTRGADWHNNYDTIGTRRQTGVRHEAYVAN